VGFLDQVLDVSAFLSLRMVLPQKRFDEIIDLIKNYTSISSSGHRHFVILVTTSFCASDAIPYALFKKSKLPE